MVQPIVHARLDPETKRLFAQLRRKTGLNDSELVRRAIRALFDAEVLPAGQRIAGLGAFESGVADLGSNEEHLEGFGRS